MTLSRSSRGVLAALCSATLALALTACGTAVSTSSFKGEQHAVAQAIADLQSNAAASEQDKVCANDLSASLVRRLSESERVKEPSLPGGRAGCERAIKRQLSEIDNFEASVQGITIDAAKGTATASVKSTHEGKKRTATLTLVHEGGRWRVSGLG
jgi:hypothetical protein